jgi:hypothetical protein
MTELSGEFVGRINDFIRDAGEVAQMLAARDQLPIMYVHVESALVELFDLDEGPELLRGLWTRDSILSALEDYNFHKLFPTVVAEARFARSIIPPGVPRSLREQIIKVNGEIWLIYKNDADPFPSNPHAHNSESGHKLHLGTGGLYLKRELVGKIAKRHLLAIRRQVVGHALPLLSR